MRKSLEISDKLRESVSPILEQQDRIQRAAEDAKYSRISVSLPELDTLKGVVENDIAKDLQENSVELNAIAEMCSEIASSLDADIALNDLHNGSTFHTIGELEIKSVTQTYQSVSPELRMIETCNNSFITNLAAGLTALVTNPVMKEIKAVTSNLGKWLQTIDFSPLTSILENIRNIGFDYDYEEVNEAFLKAMFDARWFPYAGWFADYRIVDEVLEILDTSRASKNRIKRIDKLIFSYYDKEEINNVKRGWRQMTLPSYMTRILVQSVQAYHRREYALTVSALSTLWEGIIQEKVNDSSYRVSRKTRKNLTKLIEENEFDEIFSSFCEEFIFYNCNKAEDVKPDVPGRHGIAHCWYDTYPSRKMALNAILFTDFLLGLKPLEKTEEVENG